MKRSWCEIEETAFGMQSLHLLDENPHKKRIAVGEQQLSLILRDQTCFFNSMYSGPAMLIEEQEEEEACKFENKLKIDIPSRDLNCSQENKFLTDFRLNPCGAQLVLYKPVVPLSPTKDSSKDTEQIVSKIDQECIDCTML
jgi:hypothetical protein